MNDRPTPETDAAANESIVKVYETSQKLERERDELRVEVERLRIRLTHFAGLIQAQRDAMKGDA